MRTARIKPVTADDGGTYYHIVNRIAGATHEFPFGDTAKERFTQLMHRLATFYTVEILSWVVMSNHFHIIVFAPAEAPSPEETAKRYGAFYSGTRTLDVGSSRCQVLASRLHDISWFTGELEQRFTCWFNRHTDGNRRGTLWQGRFKSVVLEGESAVWECLKYIELNAVRAGLVADPGDYRFSSWGTWCGNGKHPYADQLFRHLQRLRGGHTASWSLVDFQRELRKELARVVTGEAGGSAAQIEKAVAAATPEPPTLVTFNRRVRYWTDGLVIGSRLFIRETLAPFMPPAQLDRHRVSPPTRLVPTAANAPPLCIHAWRRLRYDLA